jgi:hypothetical protein
MMFVSGKASGSGAGSVPAGSATLAVNAAVTNEWKTQFVTETESLPPTLASFTATVTDALEQGNVSTLAVKVIVRPEYVIEEGLYVTFTGLRLVFAENVAPFRLSGSPTLVLTTAELPLQLAVPPGTTAAAVGAVV